MNKYSKNFIKNSRSFLLFLGGVNHEYLRINKSIKKNYKEFRKIYLQIKKIWYDISEFINKWINFIGKGGDS